ncbi:hypothetical protein QBC38DRAFT_277950 [Podospora fimiseda]|uniref:Uncharacterized protein n=1 Tax=Podospora fimiseda TaxID=252190 RepID=A0AAN7BXC2_9PEZI|nr:hypothetical protein QBC38DRAFT_277950 [Podospora fimiseda]
MPIIRNPFARRPGVAAPQSQDENAAVHRREDQDTTGSRTSSAWSIRSSRKSQDTGEYKMSVVNDSGIYLPPSPVEKQAIWPRRYLSRNSESRRSGDHSSIRSGEIEHFPISRESFDSYRRSFDICAKRPVIITSDTYNSRQSLDSSRFFSSRNEQYTPRSSLAPRARNNSNNNNNNNKPTVPELEPEEDVTPGFEDVVLGDDINNKPAGETLKKRSGFFSRLGHHSEEVEKDGAGWSFGMVGRRHNHTGAHQQVQVQELGAITRPMTRDHMKGVEVEV